MWTLFFCSLSLISCVTTALLYKKNRELLRLSQAEGEQLRQQRKDVGRDFVANASHELRTPITIIKGFLETLKDMPELSQDLFDDIMTKMLRSCERMESLVKSLLLLADLENSPKSGYEAVDLIELIDEVSYNLISIHQEATIETYYRDESVFIWGNTDLLKVAFKNLLENAVKYSKGPARIVIQIHVDQNTCCVKIKDQGLGIPQKDIPHLFDRFYTVDKTHSRRLGGAGLGLSIVKKIIDNHKGSIEVTSKFQEWTEFTMRFFLKESCLSTDIYEATPALPGFETGLK